jgi:predicted extracellular nuclease
MVLVALVALGAWGCTTEEGQSHGGGNTDTWNNTNDTVGETATPDDTTPDGTNPGDTIIPPDGTNPDVPVTGSTVQAIQKDQRGLDCNSAVDNFIDLTPNVQLEGLTVVSSAFYAGTDLQGLFVADGNGAWNGILLVFGAEAFPTVDFVPGDVLTVTGDAQEAFCMTEIDVLTATKTASGAALPTPDVVTAADVASFGGPKAEDYEGTYVTLQNVAVTDINAQYGTFTVDDKLVVDDTFRHGFYPKAGCGLTTLRGVMHFSYGEFKLLPLSGSDIVVDTTKACELQGGPMTIHDIQADATSTGCSADGPQSSFKGIQVSDVLVMTPGFASSTFTQYFASDGTTGEFSGVLLNVATATDPGLVPGDVIDVTGEAMEYYCQTQLVPATIEKKGTNALPSPKAVTLADVNSAAAEPYEGTYVELSGVEVKEITQYGDYYLGTASGTDKLLVDNHFKHGVSPKVGCQIAKVSGFVGYTYGEYKLEPVDAAAFEFVPGSDCANGTAPGTDVTLADLQTNAAGTGCTADSGSFVTIQNGVTVKGLVVASARHDASNTLHGYYVAEGPGANHGVLLVVAKTPETNYAVGTKLDVTGDAMDYYCMTELKATSVAQNGTGDAPEPAVVDYAEFAANPEPYEGTLVALTGKVTDAAPAHGAFILEGLVQVGTIFYTPETKPAADATVTVRGFLRYGYSTWILEPRDASDLVL